jgi:integrase
VSGNYAAGRLCRIRAMSKKRRCPLPDFLAAVSPTTRHLIDVHVAWSKAVKAAGLDYFWIYDLRHTFASRITEAGVSPLFVAQIMGTPVPIGLLG